MVEDDFDIYDCKTVQNQRFSDFLKGIIMVEEHFETSGMDSYTYRTENWSDVCTLGVQKRQIIAMQ